MTESRADATAAALDRQGVRDACMRYWAGIDQKDGELFAAAFTPDAVISLLGGEKVVSVADIVDGGIGGGWEYTSHSVASQVVEVTGDTAVAKTFVVAHLVPHDGPILVRGLRYHDELVRDGVDWRIRRRDQAAVWQYDAERVTPHLS